MTTLLANGKLQREACDRLENVAGNLESWADTEDRIADLYVMEQDHEQIQRHRNTRDNFRIQASVIRESITAINNSDARRGAE